MSQDKEDDRVEAVRLDLLRLAESGEDYEAALSLAIRCAGAPDRWLRVTALHSFGYVARVYGRLDLAVVLPLLHAARDDPDAEVIAAADDALEDIETFLPGIAAA